MAIARREVLISPSIDKRLLAELDSTKLEAGIYYTDQEFTIDKVTSSQWSVICTSNEIQTSIHCFSQIWIAPAQYIDGVLSQAQATFIRTAALGAETYSDFTPVGSGDNIMYIYDGGELTDTNKAMFEELVLKYINKEPFLLQYNNMVSYRVTADEEAQKYSFHFIGNTAGPTEGDIKYREFTITTVDYDKQGQTLTTNQVKTYTLDDYSKVASTTYVDTKIKESSGTIPDGQTIQEFIESQLTTAKSELQTFATSAANTAKTEAGTYTDTQISSAKTELEATMDTKDASILSQAQTYADNALANAGKLKKEIVASTTQVTQEDVLYLIPHPDAPEGDLFDQYMLVNGKVEAFGNTRVDMTSIVTIDTKQTISGAKTFSVTPIFPKVPAEPTEGANKSYVDFQVSSAKTDMQSYTDNAVAAATGSLDSAVLLSGDQSIDGVKTFKKSPVVPEPTSGVDVANKDYVDNKVEANETNFVNVSGAQTISGAKTFTAIPATAVAPTENTHLTNKSYVDTQVAAVSGAVTSLDGAVVKTTGDQTISGTKTFSTFPVLPSSGPSTDTQAASKKYVDDQIAANAGKSNVNSDTPIKIVVSPTKPSDEAGVTILWIEGSPTT